MKIIAHRGLWKQAEEKNSETAFLRSFRLGIGTETDVRDCKGSLVISHDMPCGAELTLHKFLSLTHASSTTQPELTIALNIKADGLGGAIASVLRDFSDLDIFVFDMSIPDMRSYLNLGIPTFTRMSEVERHPPWLKEATGVWLDSFYTDWYDVPLIESLLAEGKRVCIVSPELHHRPHKSLWDRLRVFKASDGVILCTDHPEEALCFFS